MRKLRISLNGNDWVAASYVEHKISLYFVPLSNNFDFVNYNLFSDK
jgi:hypothetical protein